jgi:hypothetical protein
MDPVTAQKLIALATSMDPALGEITEEIKNISDDKERARYTDAIREIMADIALRLIFPIIDQHPQLNPDKDK